MKYLSSSTVKCLIDFMALALLYVFVFFRKWKAKGRDVLLVNTLLYVYLSFVLYFTLMPIITAIPFVFNHPYRPMNMVPFIDVSMRRGDFFRQVVLNVIMTVPFGFLFPLSRNRVNRTAGFGRTVLCCFLMSLGIEILQPLVDGCRASDVTDLITNVTGGMIGYGLFLIIKPFAVRILDHLKKRD